MTAPATKVFAVPIVDLRPPAYQMLLSQRADKGQPEGRTLDVRLPHGALAVKTAAAQARDLHSIIERK
jgi:hypothetical protein